MYDHIVAGILSGGGSRRYGKNKALEVWQGKTLLEWTIQSARHLTDDIYILAKNDNRLSSFEVPVLTDPFSVSTPINGILSIRPYVKEWLLILACDIPFVKPQVLDLLWNNKEKGKAAVFQIYGGLHPFVALYHRESLEYWQKAFDQERYYLREIVDNMPKIVFTVEDIQTVDPDLQSFININTPRDMKDLKNGGYNHPPHTPQSDGIING